MTTRPDAAIAELAEAPEGPFVELFPKEARAILDYIAELEGDRRRLQKELDACMLTNPWSPAPAWMFGKSIEARNALQNSGKVHPLTCGNNRCDKAHTDYAEKHGGDFGQLVAVEGGWLCPVCGYTQALAAAQREAQP